MTPTITLAQANHAVDSYIDRAMAQLPANLTLKERLRLEADPCDDPDDGGALGRKIASRNYEVLGVNPREIPSHFDTLRRWWERSNFRVLDNNPQYEFLWVENNDDGFRMTVKANPEGHLYLIAASPCVWPNGTPPPDA